MTTLPAWVKEIYAPWESPAATALALVDESDDAAFLAAFARCAREADQAGVSGKQVATVRKRLLRAESDLFLPHLPLLFAVAVELDAKRGQRVFRQALTARHDTDDAHRKLHRALLVSAAPRFFTARDFERFVLRADLASDRSARDGGACLELGRVVASCALSTERLEEVAQQLITRRAKTAGVPEKNLLCLVWVALALRGAPQARERAEYSRLVATREPAWAPLLKQDLAAVDRFTAAAARRRR